MEVEVADGTPAGTEEVAGSFPVPFEALEVDFAADGRSAVLFSSEDSVATLVDLTDGQQTSTTPPNRPGTTLSFRAVGDGAAQLWDDGGVTLLGPDGAVRQELETHHEPVRDVVMSPDGTWAATVGDGPTIVLWGVDRSTGRWHFREQLTGHAGDVLDAEVDPSGLRLITVGLDHSIITWDMSADGGFGESYPGLTGRWISNRPQAVPGGLVVAPTRTGAFDTADRFSNPGPETTTVAASFLDPMNGSVVEQVVLGDTIEDGIGISSVAVSPDRSMVAVTWGLGTTVLDTRNREVIKEIVVPPSGATDHDEVPFPATIVLSAGWTPDGSTLLLGASRDVGPDTRGYLAPVDTTTWEQGSPIETGGTAATIELSPDETVFAVASTDAPEVLILDAETLEVLRRVPLATGDRIFDLSFSPDGRWLAGGGHSGVVHVFETDTWEAASSSITLHDHWMLQLEWLRDSHTVVTTGGDGTVSLFDVERGLARTRPLPGSGEPGKSPAHLMPSPTDALVVLRGDRSGWRYPLRSSAWLSEACAIAGRDLTTAEWDRYLPGREYQHTCTDLP
jgi:WD40 repeat protein